MTKGLPAEITSGSPPFCLKGGEEVQYQNPDLCLVFLGLTSVEQNLYLIKLNHRTRSSVITISVAMCGSHGHVQTDLGGLKMLLE